MHCAVLHNLNCVVGSGHRCANCVNSVQLTQQLGNVPNGLLIYVISVIIISLLS